MEAGGLGPHGVVAVQLAEVENKPEGETVTALLLPMVEKPVRAHHQKLNLAAASSVR